MRLVAKNILAPISTKTTEFEMKNKCESKSRAFIVVILFFFEGNKMHLAVVKKSIRNELERLAIVGRSNNVEVWGQSPLLPETNRAPDT